MTISNSVLCMGCMSPQDASGRCTACGYDGSSPVDPKYLAPGMAISSRYTVGTLHRKNGEGAMYVGYDNGVQQKVWIREYFPTSLAQRDAANGSVSPLAGLGAQYKAFMSDFNDLCNEVRRLSISDAVIPILDVVFANNTIYAVYKDMGVISFEDFLSRNQGALPLEKAQQLMIPLLNTVENIHSQGSIHRGLSPYTIYIDQKGKMYLWDFSLAPTRTANSELQAELFNGYSAPEQYAANGWQGAWTDVYALGALFYRTLTGFVPPKSILRNSERDLAPIDELLDVPDEVAGAITKAMLTSAGQRTQTVAAFTSQILQNSSQSTAIYDVSAKEKQAPQPTGRKGRQPAASGRSRKLLYSVLSIAVLVMVLLGGMWGIVSSYFPELVGASSSSSSVPPPSLSEPSSEEEVSSQSSAPVDNKVPRFVGVAATEVQNNSAYQARFEFVVKEEYHSTYPAGMVYEQSPAEGTPMPNRGNVILYVSKGRKEYPMPAVVGLTKEEAMQILLEQNFVFDVFEKYDKNAEPGLVVSTYPEPGSMVDPEQENIYIVVNTAPEDSSSKADKDKKEDKDKSSEPD